MRSCLLQIGFLLAGLLLCGCAGESRCDCEYNCSDGVVMCIETPDGLFCAPPGADLKALPAREDSAADRFVQDGAFPDSWSEGVADEDAPSRVAPDVTSDEEQPPEGPFEFRALWVTRWDFDSPETVETILEQAELYGFNAVMFQVRGMADAYYDSAYEPWAKGLSGTLGEDPGWDPLQVAVEEAHARGLELHAWINTFNAWVGTTPPPESDPPHILHAHPEWRQVDGSGNPMEWNNSSTWVSPGIPEVREHVISVAIDIVGNYEVDGLHFDYIRYAGPDYSHDQWSEQAFGAARAQTPGLTWEDFQRDTLTAFMQDAYVAIVQEKPEVKVSAAVWGIYQEVFGWGGTSEGYYDYYQDSHRWLEVGALDAICPMVYWPLTEPKGGWTDFATLADHHLAAAAGRHVYMGIKADYGDFAEIEGEISYLRQMDGPGWVIFAYSTLISHGYGELLAELITAEPATTPPMPWKTQ